MYRCLWLEGNFEVDDLNTEGHIIPNHSEMVVV